jgi:hypothetical protein
MSGVAVILELLSTNAAVLARVPAINIMAGVIPLGTVLPAIGVVRISLVPRLTTGMNGAQTLNFERVQATVQAKSYDEKTEIAKLLVPACPNTRGVVVTFFVDSILPDLGGPDMFNPDAKIEWQTQDFIVKWKS